MTIALKVRESNKCLKSYPARFILALLHHLIFWGDRERKDECNSFFFGRNKLTAYI